MVQALRAMSGPTKIIELDGIPVKNWKIDPNAVHLFKGKLWSKEPVGCICCVEREGPEFTTFSTVDSNGVEHFQCMEHGTLVEIPYSMRKVYTIKIGDVVREGEQSVDDTMLFPAEMEVSVRNALIDRLLDEADKDEIEAGPQPEEDE